jgi:hypothetical protein
MNSKITFKHQFKRLEWLAGRLERLVSRYGIHDKKINMKNDVTQKFVPSEVNDFLFFVGMTYVHINVERPREINIQR